jgi:hypothetical protein
MADARMVAASTHRPALLSTATEGAFLVDKLRQLVGGEFPVSDHYFFLPDSGEIV